MRRVVAAPDSENRSYVVEDGQVEPGLLWRLDPADTAEWIEQLSRGETFTSYEPIPGGALWALAELPPAAGTTPQGGDRSVHGMDDDGFHVTRTVDFIVALDAGLVLGLDDGDVVLQAGDGVVLQAARHVWRNPTDEPVRFLSVLVGQVRDA